MTDEENTRTRSCNGCGQEFGTLTRLRSHNCSGEKSGRERSSSPGKDGDTSYSGVIETWMGKTEVSYATSYVPNTARGEECALCVNDAVEVLDTRLEWIDWLCEERNMTRPIGRLQIPLCIKCYLRMDTLNEGEKEYGMYGEDAQTSIDAEREEILSELNLDILNDMAFET